MKVWLNGKFIDHAQATVPILSHSFSRGSAIFEVLDIVSTERGPALFGLNEHIDRFFHTAELTYMEIPISRNELISAIIKTARENNVSFGAVKFFAYYSAEELSIIPSNPKVDIAIFCIDFDLLEITQEFVSHPVSVGISSIKKLDPMTIPIHAKVTGSYMSAFLAKQEMIKKGYEDVIMLDTRGYVAEGATSNIFLIKNGAIKTPTLKNVLPGITRKVIIETIKDMGYPFQETDIKPDALATYDEAFYSGSIVKIQPIRSIEGMPLGNSCPGPMTRAIMDMMKDIYKGKNKKFEKWFAEIR